MKITKAFERYWSLIETDLSFLNKFEQRTIKELAFLSYQAGRKREKLYQQEIFKKLMTKYKKEGST